MSNQLVNKVDLLSDFKNNIASLLKNNKPDFCIALSGGLDSIVLLHLFSRLRCESYPIKLNAHHVHHGLSNNADHWLNFCEQQCSDLNITFHYTKVNLEKKSRTSLESVAREKRYESLKKCLQANSFLTTAHHQDDQLETVLLALKRGSGIAGLQGIRSIQKIEESFLIRPLLIFSREQLEDYAKYFKLNWIEDESNQDEQFDRNFIRQAISPLLRARWPAITKTFSRSAKLLQEQQLLLEEIASEDLSNSFNQQDDHSSINITKLLCFSITRQKNVLRHWFKCNALQYPSAKKMTAIFNELINAGEQADPKIEFEHLALRRYRDNLYFVSKVNMPMPKQAVIWKGEKTLLLDGLTKVLSFNDSQSKGIEIEKNAVVEIYFREHLPAKLTCTPAGRVGNRSVKKLLHEYQVPPWQRDQIPFIFVNGELIQAVGLWVCAPQKKVMSDIAKEKLHIFFI